MNDKELLGIAKHVRESAYCPYSGVAVGAALLTESGKVYTGINIENASYSPTVCAERVAFFSAIERGERSFKKIAIAGGPWGRAATSAFSPCGVCRQVMAEFCDGDFEIILAEGDGTRVYRLSELLPASFTKELL